MSTYRILVILLALGLAGAAVFKIAGARRGQQSNEPDLAQSERIREFWDTYKQAGQKRAANELEEAVEFYKKALDIRPEHEDSLYYLGNCSFEMGRYGEAIGSYRQLILVNPLGSSRGYVQLALVHACLEPGAPFDLQKAESFFNKALEVDPDSGAMLGIGEVAMLAGRWGEARKALESDHADNAMGMASAYLLGYLCWRKGEREDAWHWFRLAIQRGELKKPAVKWTEEGDVKADPELRWRALARQSVFGKHWVRLRKYLKTPDYSRANMDAEYRLLQGVLASERR